MKAKLLSDYKEAMKNKDTIAKNVISAVRSAISWKEKELQVDNLDAEQLDEILFKEKKTITESLDEAIKANRQDLIAENQTALKVLAAYLPAELSDDEIAGQIKEIAKASNMEVTNPKLKGIIMKEMKNKAEGKRIMDVLKTLD